MLKGLLDARRAAVCCQARGKGRGLRIRGGGWGTRSGLQRGASAFLSLPRLGGQTQRLDPVEGWETAFKSCTAEENESADSREKENQAGYCVLHAQMHGLWSSLKRQSFRKSGLTPESRGLILDFHGLPDTSVLTLKIIPPKTCTLATSTPAIKAGENSSWRCAPLPCFNRIHQTFLV